jgi:predicted PurR-regulated permease PerM
MRLLGWRPMPGKGVGPDPDAKVAEPRPGPESRRAKPIRAARGTPEHHEPSVLSVRVLVTAALIVLAIVALAAFLASIISIVLLVLVAIVFAEGIRPLVQRMRARNIPQPLGIVIVYVAVLVFLGFLIALLVQPIVSEATSLANNFPTYQRNFLSFFNSVQKQFNFNFDITKQVGNLLDITKQVLFSVGGTIGAVIANFVLVLVLAFLWLVSSERLKRFAVDLFPERHQELATDVFREMGYRMGGFLRAVAINSIAVGVAVGLASFFLGLPSPIVLGVFAGLTAAVPLIGPFIGVIPPVLLGFTIGPVYPVLVLAVLLVIQLVDANTVVPLVMNRVVALPALGVVLALLIGGTLQGLIGALLAVPVAAALQVVVVRVIVPAVHAAQGRTDRAYAGAYTPLSPHLKASAPRGGGRRANPR